MAVSLHMIVALSSPLIRLKQFTSSTFANLLADGPSSWHPFIKLSARTYFTASLAIILPTNSADRTSS